MLGAGAADIDKNDVVCCGSTAVIELAGACNCAAGLGRSDDISQHGLFSAALFMTALAWASIAQQACRAASELARQLDKANAVAGDASMAIATIAATNLKTKVMLTTTDHTATLNLRL